MDNGYHYVYPICQIYNGEICAVQKSGNMFVAKVFNLSRKNTRQAAYYELRLMLLCNHQNVVRAVNFFQDDDFACIVMPKYRECDIYEYLMENENKLLNFITDVSAGLQYLHQLHIIHRDLNPSNIFVDQNGHFVIGDLGSAQLCHRNNNNEYVAQVMVGSAPFRAPEMLNTTYSFCVDLWNFGLMIHELVHGQFPFEFETEAEFLYLLKHFEYQPESRNNLIDDLIWTLLNKNPCKRYEYTKVVAKLQ
uniref:Kinase, NEK n=1 Tax=Trepomonas sp. PC1 TaxID=1076344 RepID=A0A146KAA1_9EUKA|eukprot:JAP92319.1 Kinase, NEK [Trepomonas sp. PC1]